MSFMYFWDKSDSFGSNEEGFPFLICKKKQKTKTKTKQKKTKHTASEQSKTSNPIFPK